MNGLDQTRAFSVPTKIVSGMGTVSALPDIVSELESSPTVLCVSDPGLRAAGVIDAVEDALRAGGVKFTTFDEVTPDPDVEVVHACEAAREASAANVVVAIGGGSSMDTAKAVAVLGTNGGDVRQYEGRNMHDKPPLPLVAIPTTVGTGSEVTMGCVVADHERKVKFIIGSPTLAPRVTVLDPDLVSSLPGPIAAATGMDALTHAIEGFVSRWATPMTDALTLHGIRLIAKYLRPAVGSASNREAIATMLAASTTIGMGFGNARLGICHALAHPIQAHAGTVHGVTNGVLLPHVMDYNWIAAPEKFRLIDEALGATIPTPDGAAKTLAALRDDIGLPSTLAEIGVLESHFDPVVEVAYADGYVEMNPRSVSPVALHRILSNAF